jgi:predicted XRE-type DNA-binding protein
MESRTEDLPMTETVTRGTANVFAGLGLPDTAERQTKTQLAMALKRILKDQRLKQVDAARLLGVPQPRFRRWSIAGSTASRSKS